MQSDHTLYGLRERESLLPTPAGVLAKLHGAAVLQGLRSSLGQRDDGVGAQTDVEGDAVDAEALAPGLGPAARGAGLDQEGEAVSAPAIAVPSGAVNRLDKGGGERLG